MQCHNNKNFCKQGAIVCISRENWNLTFFALGNSSVKKFINQSRGRFGFISKVALGQIKIGHMTFLVHFSQRMPNANSRMFLASCVKLHVTMSLTLLVVLILVVINFKFHSNVLEVYDS